MDTDKNLLAKVIRGNTMESFHQGHIAVVDKKGRLVYSLGDPNLVTFIRSAAKPLQAVVVIESGAAENYSLTNEEIALMSASHSGEDIHVTIGQGFLNKLGLSEQALGCGCHLPKDVIAANKLLAAGKNPSPLHNNCSGKHLGMLALALHRNNSLEDYVETKHPVQQEILRGMSEFCHLAPENFEVGIDGCGVPVYAMPIFNMAFAYAKLSSRSKGEPASKRLVESMLQFPHLVAGTNQLCTDIMAATKGKLVAKVGTEAVYCIGLLEEELGIAVKISDGSPRALGPVIVEVLNQLGVLSSIEREQLAKWRTRELTNHRRQTIGKIISSVQLVPN